MAVGGSALDPGQTTRLQMATGNSRVSRHTHPTSRCDPSRADCWRLGVCVSPAPLVGSVRNGWRRALTAFHFAAAAPSVPTQFRTSVTILPSTFNNPGPRIAYGPVVPPNPNPP